MEDCLGTHLIIRGILQHFSNSELLQLSLVNKLWNNAARSLMANRGNVNARINKNGACQDLRLLPLYLRQMKAMKRVVPFSGMNITLGGLNWSHADWCKESSAEELNWFYDQIVDQMTWKNLAVNCSWDWDQCRNCPSFLLMKKIFQKRSCTLEELTLRLENKREFVVQILQDCSLPNLKTLRLHKGNLPGMPCAIKHDYTILIKTIVSKAPNLQALYTEERVDLYANLLEGCSAVHFTDYEYSSSLDEIPEGVVGQLRMQRMRLESVSRQFSIDRFNGITSALLQNSRNSLNSIEIQAIFLLALRRYEISLPSVRALTLKFTRTGLEIRQPRLWRLLKSFDFKRLFPNLSTVQISWMFNSDGFEPMLNAFDETIEQENAAFIAPMPDRAENIKTVSLQWIGGILDSSTEFLVQMFPHIQKLSIRSQDLPSTHTWGSWPDLRELDITLTFRSIEKFDGAFCGIFPEEVAELQKQDEEYLRRANIVPVMPSIACLKGLRTLNLSLTDSPLFCGRVDDQAVVISQVKGLIAFQRCPILTVTVIAGEDNRDIAPRRLRPYANVVLKSNAAV